MNKFSGLAKLLGGFINYPLIDDTKIEFTEKEQKLINNDIPSITSFKYPSNLGLSKDNIIDLYESSSDDDCDYLDQALSIQKSFEYSLI